MAERKCIKLDEIKVKTKEELTNNTFYITFERNFNFTPGQVIALAVNPNDEPRLYSIASGIHENEIGVLFDVHNEGELTPQLAKLNIGDTVFISKPFGNFIWDEKPSIWIATGTGIAPFISMIKSYQPKNVTLLHGARKLDQFYFQELIESHLKGAYQRFCTSESGPGIVDGRLTNHLNEKNNLPKDYKYYLCGNSQMVIDVREILLAKQIPFEHIIAEIYF